MQFQHPPGVCGELFDPRRSDPRGRFSRARQDLIFFFSFFQYKPVGLDFDGEKMHELLSTYVQGLIELGGEPSEQHLLVVFSKGDLLGSRLDRWESIRSYLQAGDLDNLQNLRLKAHIAGMAEVSAHLKSFTEKELGAQQFINFACDQFKSLEFSIISSLGAKPVENRLQVEITPRCIFDPLFWVTYKSLGWLRRKFFF